MRCLRMLVVLLLALGGSLTLVACGGATNHGDVLWPASCVVRASRWEQYQLRHDDSSRHPYVHLCLFHAEIRFRRRSGGHEERRHRCLLC